MTEQEMIDAFEAHSNEITALLEGSDLTTINGKDSVRKIVKDNINTLARSWDISKQYLTGDSITYNTNLYLCKKCNVGMNPSVEFDTWLKINAEKNIGESGVSKKCCIREGKIISGKEYFSNYTVINGSDSSQLVFEFKEHTDNDNYIIYPTYVNKDTYEVFALGIDPYKKSKTGFTLLSRNNQSIYPYNVAGYSYINDYHDEPYEINILIKEV